MRIRSGAFCALALFVCAFAATARDLPVVPANHEAPRLVLGPEVADLASSPLVLDAPPVGASNAAQQSLIRMALTLRDIAYRYGGNLPSTGFDCSGFVRYVFARVMGINLPHSSRSQFHEGTRVARSQLHAGDLVFFRTRGRHVSHVGIYLSDGRFIHAPAAGQSVRVDTLSSRYWSRRYMGARRLLAQS
ncbi:C40 family peptidase [Oleiagrimonas sp. C23AA]|uniref:C40 family peptidase n=1 Tax=Oleiagrimonas sp. C23AA TaxID=2719047 RepID=UPI001423FE15|nr:C40 family peptidase [Oleiagrimonas sp. C23AA]NII10067.1 C40 family peptidase [Oleiagrimonas sp. C23AA]